MAVSRSISRFNSNPGATEGTIGQHEPANISGLIMVKHQNSIDPWCILLAIRLNVNVTDIAFRTLWVVQWTAALREGLTKISVLLLYGMIFLGKVSMISTLIVMGLCIIWTISFFFTHFCTRIVPMLYAMTISDVNTDVRFARHEA